MSNPICLYFVKFFSKECYADQFLDGKIFANRLSYFKNIEEECADGRSDRNEVVAAWLQPGTTSITFSGLSNLNISSSDLASPVTVAFDFHADWHVYCLHTIYLDGFEIVDGKFYLSEEQKENFEQQLKVDDRCIRFGNFAVMVRVDCFIEQLKKEIRKTKKHVLGGLVTYYDPSTFNGNFKFSEIPFHKQNRFAYQREYRLCFPTADNGNDPLIFDIGDISAFSAKVETAKINELIQIKYDQPG